jgi:Leucine-rich repeat (LRR) protein
MRGFCAVDEYINSLDTDITIIDLSDADLTYIPDLTRFINLDKIIFYNNELTTLPKLPINIKYINGHHNRITDISDIAQYINLEYLEICYNDIKVIPNLSNLKKLEVLHCGSNKITNIIRLPNNLEVFGCKYNKIKKIKYLPNKLKTLFCGHNQLKTLPKLGRHLDRIQCYENNITKLPKLNKKLRVLYCFNNKLTRLPEIKHTQLVELFCHNNQIDRLPEFNDGLMELGCAYNKLTTLPAIPYSLTSLFIYDNPVYEILKPYMDTYITENINIINKVLTTMQNFKFSYYCAKYKKQFRQILWEQVRERHIMNKYSPCAIATQIEDNEDLEAALDLII